jgi:phage major head subunit gpT-like protein
MPIVRGDYAMLLAPGLVMKTVTRYTEKPEKYRMFNNVQDSKKAYEEDYGLSGLGVLQEKGELGTHILDQPIKLGLSRFVHRTYALGIAFSQESRDDDQYSVIMDLAGMLGRSARWTAELWGHDVLNLGFSTVRYTGRDNLALFSTNHPVQGTNGTLANRPITDTDLSAGALEAAIQSFGSITEERGMPIESVPRKLLVHPENEMNARRLLQSIQYPGSNLNDVNVLKDANLELIVSPYFTDTDAWYLLGDNSDVDLRFYWREMPDTKTWDDDNADATFHKIRMRLSVGFADWRHTYASAGG